MTTVDDPNLGLAFGLTFAAGMATAIGAAVVFVPGLVKLASRKTLAGALGLSAGVMTYVSFVEIFGKSRINFESAGNPGNLAYVYATACFFGGVVLMTLLNLAVTALLGRKHHHDLHPEHQHDSNCRHSTESMAPTDGGENELTPAAVEAAGVAACPCCSDDPVADLEKVRKMAAEMEQQQLLAATTAAASTAAYVPPVPDEEEGGEAKVDADGQPAEEKDKDNNEEENNNLVPSQGETDEAHRRKEAENKKLMRMSINTALAIGLHNFPEGLATFLSTLADPRVGIVLAVAIAIHNIPEGLCVAMPVYYATGSRWKAFGWALLSGVSEPLAAVLGWAVLASVFSDVLYATLFGIVAGMMVMISVRELLPTAHRYDSEDSVVAYSFIGGMFIIALSLVLFVV